MFLSSAGGCKIALKAAAFLAGEHFPDFILLKLNETFNILRFTMD